MYISNKFSKIVKRGSSPPTAPLIFDFGDLKLCDFVFIVFSNWL